MLFTLCIGTEHEGNGEMKNGKIFPHISFITTTFLRKHTVG